MGLIEFAKRSQRRLVDGLCPAPVVYHHIAKCGGTSVARSLRMRYLASQTTVLPNETERVASLLAAGGDDRARQRELHHVREALLLYHLERDIRCISAHVRFSARAAQAHGGRYAFVTVLREPTARFVSHFRWQRRRDPHAVDNEDEAMRRFLETPMAARFGSFQVDFMMGADAVLEDDPARRLERATTNLGRLDLVGTLEGLEAFQQALGRLVGARLHIGHHNRTAVPASGARTAFSDETRADIARICAPDLALYAAARQMPQAS